MIHGDGRVVFLTMDVEEWTDYFFLPVRTSRSSPSVLDGAHRFLDLISQLECPATFFVLDHIVRSRPELVRRMVREGHEVASHGADHRLLSMVGDDEFRESLVSAKHRLEDTTGVAVKGYRAPALSMTARKLDLLGEIGFVYDSSVVDPTSHPLYGVVHLEGWERRSQWIYERDGIFEFKIPSARVLGWNIPVAGGGFMRMMPWGIFRRLLLSTLGGSGSHLVYVHPFECTSVPVLDSEVGWLSRSRFQMGRGRALWQIPHLVSEFQKRGFVLSTFADYLVGLSEDRSQGVSGPGS